MGTADEEDEEYLILILRELRPVRDEEQCPNDKAQGRVYRAPGRPSRDEKLPPSRSLNTGQGPPGPQEGWHWRMAEVRGHLPGERQHKRIEGPAGSDSLEKQEEGTYWEPAITSSVWQLPPPLRPVRQNNTERKAWSSCYNYQILKGTPPG